MSSAAMLVLLLNGNIFSKPPILSTTQPSAGFTVGTAVVFSGVVSLTLELRRRSNLVSGEAKDFRRRVEVLFFVFL